MIILGERHQFSTSELDTIKARFQTIHFIPYGTTESYHVIDEIESHLQGSKKSTILLNTKASIPDDLLAYLVKLESKNIRYITVESFMEKCLSKCYIPEDQTNISFLENIKPFSIFEYIQKRTIDYLALLVLSPIVLFVIPYAIYRQHRESPGSIFFRQTRVGLNGKKFTCFKFRSMHENSHHDPYTRENDSRIFPWGNTMRKTRIDELPQLWNILRGDMHLIGPRAEWDILVENYERDIPYYYERHLVKPGITGWAQVNYPYGANTEDAKQKLMYDLFYIKYWNLLLEIKTSFLTVLVMKKKKGL